MEKFKLQNKVIAKKLLAMLITFTLIFAHYALVGSSVVEAAAEALERQNTITRGNNVEFDAYFDQNNEQTHTGVLLAEETQKLYIQLSVKDKVSVPEATIKIEDPNFSIKEDEIKESKYVESINVKTNEIKLENISSNNTAIIELPIQLKKEEKVDNQYFNKEVILKIEGTQENVNQKETELKGEVKIQPQWTSNTDIKLTQSIQKYFSLGEKGTLLEQQIETEIENNVFPRSSEEVEVKAPDLGGGNPNNVTVLIDGEHASEDKIEYNKETGIVKISYQNQINEEQEIDWKESKRVYNIMYKYESSVPVEEKSIQLSSKTKTNIYAKTDAIDKEETKEEVITPIGNIATVETLLTGDIYKGYLYENEAKEILYEENNQITVSYTEGIEKVALESNNETYTNENREGLFPAENIRYVKTVINKEQLISLLGEEGRIYVKRPSGEEITSIGNETQTDEAGNIVVNYAEAEKEIIIETTKPQKEGKLNILNQKAINGQIGQPREVVKRIKNIVTSPTVATNISQEGATAAIELKETTSEAKIEINRESLSTVNTNQDVEIKAVLSSNSEKQDLYANPSLMIEFPTDVQEVNVKSIDKLYGDEFTQINPSQGVLDGKQTIYIELVGEQTEHKESGIEGTIINIKADIKLNKKATSKQDVVQMAYANGKAIQYEKGSEVGLAEVPLEIISPKGLITTNNIEALQIETVGEEKGVEKEIETNNEEQIYTVNSEIINNDEEAVKDVKILGTFGTKGKSEINGEEYESNINSELTTGLSVEAQDTSKVKIYYSENEKATDDLEDKENDWKETITNPQETKKYLITVSNMEIEEEIKAGYNIKVPANLQYNQQMHQGYTTTYTKAEQQEEEQSTIIRLTTGQGPQLTTKLSAKVGDDSIKDGAEVNRNEIIRYDVDVENTGDRPISGAKVIAQIPEGTTLISRQNTMYNEEQNRTVELEVGELQINETKTIRYEVKVNSETTPGTQIKMSAIVQAEGREIKTNETTAIVGERDGALEVIVSGDDNEDIVYEQGKTFACRMKITNKTNNELKNIVTRWSAPKEVERIFNGLITQATSNNEDEIVIESLDPGESEYVLARFEVKENTDKPYIEITGTAECKNTDYRATNAIVRLTKTYNYDFSMSSDEENDYIKAGDNVTYTIKVKNRKDIPSGVLIIKDTIPNELSIIEASISTNKSEEITSVEYNGKTIECDVSLDAKEEKTLTLKTVANYQDGLKQDRELINKATLEENFKEVNSSNEIKVILEAEEQQDPSNPGGNTTPGGDVTPGGSTTQGGNTGEEPGGSEEIKTGKKINGTAWVDSNLDGAREDEEQVVGGMTVKLLNAQTNEFAKDVNGNEIQAITDENGFYTLTDVPQGEYIVLFEYDATTYKITEYRKEGVEESRNSKAISKSLNINNEEKLYGITDVIQMQEENIPNINIGLVTTGKFDLSLDKYLSKVTVRTVDGIETHNYNNETLAKVELSGKKIEGANVIIEYNIVVTNNGEVAGYATSIKDKIPGDLSFNSELNPDWHQEGMSLVSNSLENQIIVPGESKTIKLILTKTMTQNNTGIITNTAEIQDAYNNDGIEDTNSIPGNGNKQEDDYGSADTIISIKTGGAAAYTTLILLLAMITTVGAYMFKKEIELEKIEDEIFKEL